MPPSRDVERFDRWAETYDQHWMHRVIFEPVQQAVLELAQAQVPQPRAILDVGCGTGQLLGSASLRFPGAQLTGIDPAPQMVRQAQASVGKKSSIHFESGTAESLPFSDGQFDLIFSTLTFHHWADQPKALSEIARVLAPGGRWVLADFLASGLMRYVRLLLRMTRFPDRRSLDAMLEPPGLEVVAQRRLPRLRHQLAVLAIGQTR